jgi:hypothetical protein
MHRGHIRHGDAAEKKARGGDGVYHTTTIVIPGEQREALRGKGTQVVNSAVL